MGRVGSTYLYTLTAVTPCYGERFCGWGTCIVLMLVLMMRVDTNSPITSRTAAYPGMVVLKMGLYPEISQPEAESFAAYRQKWGQPYQWTDQYKIKRLGEKFE